MKFMDLLKKLFNFKFWYSSKFNVSIKDMSGYLKMFLKLMDKKSYLSGNLTYATLYLSEIEWFKQHAYYTYKERWYINENGDIDIDVPKEEFDILMDNNYRILTKKIPSYHSRLLDKSQKMILFSKHFSKQFKIKHDIVMEFWENLWDTLNRNWTTKEMLDYVRDTHAYKGAITSDLIIDKNNYFY